MGFISEYFDNYQGFFESEYYNNSYYKFVLVYEGTSTILKDSPARWDDIGRTWQRSDFYHSIQRTYTMNFQFSRKTGFGGDIILQAYEEKGISFEITLKIYKKNGQTDDYDIWFTGVLDTSLERLGEFIGIDYVDIAAVESTKMQQFKAFEETNFNLFAANSVDDSSIGKPPSTPRSIAFPPKDIYLNTETAGELSGNFQVGTDAVASNQESFYYFSTQIPLNEIGDALKSDEGNTTNPTETIFENTRDIEVDITVSINATVSYSIEIDGEATYDYAMTPRFRVRGEGGTILETKEVTEIKASDESVPDASLDINKSVNETDYHTFSIPSGATLIYEIFVEISKFGAGVTLDFSFNSNVIDLDLLEKQAGQPETNVDCFYLHDAFAQLFCLILNDSKEQDIFESTITGRTNIGNYSYSSNGALGNFIVTSGRRIRQFPDASVNVSLRDLFKHADALSPCMLWYNRTEDKFILEDREQAYKRERMFDLGEVKDLVRRPYNRAYFSKLLTGYKEEVEYEEVNGAKEVNTPAEHLINVPVKEEINLQASYHGDGTGAELARRKPYSQFASTDTRYDEHIFIFNILSNGVVRQGGRADTTGYDGIDSDYNLFYTPRSNLIRHLPYVEPQLWKGTKRIKFVRNQKDVDFDFGTPGNEQDDITDFSGSGAKYIPEIHKFTAPITSEMIETLDADPHGYVTYFSGDDYFEGYIYKVETQEYNNKAEFEIIASSIGGEQYLARDAGDLLLTDDGQKIII